METEQKLPRKICPRKMTLIDETYLEIGGNIVLTGKAVIKFDLFGIEKITNRKIDFTIIGAFIGIQIKIIFKWCKIEFSDIIYGNEQFNPKLTASQSYDLSLEAKVKLFSLVLLDYNYSQFIATITLWETKCLSGFW